MTRILPGFVLLILVFVALNEGVNGARIRRQWNWNFPDERPIPDRNSQWGRRTSTSTTTTTTPATNNAGSTTTTQSPQVRNCIKNCQTTNQYNPVCGNNGQTYDNMAKLNCATRCGISVQMSRIGAC